MRRHAQPKLLLALAASASLTGCGPSSTPSDDDGSVSARDWVIQRLVETPEGRTAVVYLTPPIGEFDSFDDARARELPGNSRVFMHDGQAFFGDAEALTIVRTRPEHGVLIDDSPTLSVALTGLSFLPSWSAELAPDRALLIDSFEGVGVLWDPQAMTLRGRSDLSGLRIPPFEAIIESGQVRDDVLLAPVQQSNPISFEFFPGLQVAAIDKTSGDLLELIEDHRCAGTRGALQPSESGAIYLLGDNYGYAAAFTEQPAGATCILRILPGELAFDPDYQLVLPELLDGRDASSLVYWKDGRAFVSVKYDEELEFEFWDDPLEWGNQRAGHWWEIDLEGERPPRPLDMPAHALLSVSGVVVKGRLFLQNPTEQLSATTVIWEVLDDGTAVEHLEYVGLTQVIAALSRREP